MLRLDRHLRTQSNTADARHIALTAISHHATHHLCRQREQEEESSLRQLRFTGQSCGAQSRTSCRIWQKGQIVLLEEDCVEEDRGEHDDEQQRHDRAIRGRDHVHGNTES